MIKDIKTIKTLCLTCFLSCLILLLGLQRFYITSALLPAEAAKFPWKLISDSDSDSNSNPSAKRDAQGISSTRSSYSTAGLSFHYTLSAKTEYPYASMLMTFGDLDLADTFTDFSSYHTISFHVRCEPENLLALALFTFDENITRKGQTATYRLPTAFFSCDQEFKEVELELSKFRIPEWWQQQHNVDLSDQSYQLDKVMALSFGNSHQSPKSLLSSVEITKLVLHGKDWRYLYAALALLVGIWLCAALWILVEYRRQLVEKISVKINRATPSLIYRQQSLENRKDKEKQRLLKFMAEKYCDPELSLDKASRALGMNRNKINNLIKEEMGLTFSTYLNKLRLLEASRQLAEKPDSQIAEVSNTVGYKHTSYFSKLFKAEFGCTPKEFKYQQQS